MHAVTVSPLSQEQDGIARVAMRMEQSLKSGIDQMRVIFDLCDQDNDGLICAQDFREIGREYFEKPDVSG